MYIWKDITLLFPLFFHRVLSLFSYRWILDEGANPSKARRFHRFCCHVNGSKYCNKHVNVQYV